MPIDLNLLNKLLNGATWCQAMNIIRQGMCAGVSIYKCYMYVHRIYRFECAQIYIQSSIIFLRDFKLTRFCLVQYFWHVGIKDVSRSIAYDASTIPGTRKIHLVKTKIFQNGFAFDR
jgi:hypothetical protein